MNKKWGKQITSLALALCLLAGMALVLQKPLAFQASGAGDEGGANTVSLGISENSMTAFAAASADLNTATGVAWSFSTLDGAVIDQDTNLGKVQVLVFSQDCGLSRQSVRYLDTAAWTYHQDVAVTIIDTRNYSQSTVAAWKDANAPTNTSLVFTYGSGGSTAMFDYKKAATGSGGTVTYAVIVILDEYGNLRYFMDNINTNNNNVDEIEEHVATLVPGLSGSESGDNSGSGNGSGSGNSSGSGSTSGSSGSSGSRSRSSGSGSSTPDSARSNNSNATNATKEITATNMRALLAEAQKAGRDYVRLTNNTAGTSISRATLNALGDTALQVDTVEHSAVQVRISIPNPSAVEQDLRLSGAVSGTGVERIEMLFEKWFTNTVKSLHFEQQGAWGQTVRVAVKVDLSGMDINGLTFYAYNKANNQYTRIQEPDYRIDDNGYLWFSTEQAGDIVISDGPLTPKH